MSYSNASVWTVSLGMQDFTAAADTFSFKLPAGKQGRIEEVMVSCYTPFTATTTEARVDIGTASDADAYASCGMGTTADQATYLASANAGDIIQPSIPGNTEIKVATVAATGGTPTGKGVVNILVRVW